MIYRLCDGDITKLDLILELKFITVLTWLSYETEMNITK